MEHETKGEKAKRGTTSVGERTRKGNGDGRMGKSGGLNRGGYGSDEQGVVNLVDDVSWGM